MALQEVAAPAAAISARVQASQADNSPVLENAPDQQAESGKNLERHIDEALARINQLGQPDTKSE